jgi:hypothetical protein
LDIMTLYAAADAISIEPFVNDSEARLYGMA